MKTNSNTKPIYIEGDDLNADWIKNADPEAQKADIAAGEEARKMQHTNDGDKTKESGMSFLEFVTGQTETSKHLAGKHDQDRHGLRAGGNATPEQLAARKRVANMRREEASQKIQAKPKSSGGKESFKKGDLVEYKQPYEDEVGIKYRLLEEPDGGRVLVEAQVPMAIKPTYRVKLDDIKQSGSQTRKAPAKPAKPSKPSKTERNIMADKKSERQNEKKSAERLSQTSERLRKISGPKTDEQFIKLDGIRDRIDRVNKHLGIDEIGTSHLRAANATESWNKLRPAITSTLSAMRARVNIGAYHNSGELKIINALIDDINAAIDKL